MKKIILFSIYCLLWSLTGNAQRIALIDMEYILENIPAYQKANYELEQLSQQYQKAIEAKAKEAEFLYNAYQKSASTMSATQRSQKEEAIVAKEKETMKKHLSCLYKIKFTKPSRRFQCKKDMISL